MCVLRKEKILGWLQQIIYVYLVTGCKCTFFSNQTFLSYKIKRGVSGTSEI